MRSLGLPTYSLIALAAAAGLAAALYAVAVRHAGYRSDPQRVFAINHLRNLDAPPQVFYGLEKRSLTRRAGHAAARRCNGYELFEELSKSSEAGETVRRDDRWGPKRCICDLWGNALRVDVRETDRRVEIRVISDGPDRKCDDGGGDDISATFIVER